MSTQAAFQVADYLSHVWLVRVAIISFFDMNAADASQTKISPTDQSPGSSARETMLQRPVPLPVSIDGPPDCDRKHYCTQPLIFYSRWLIAPVLGPLSETAVFVDRRVHTIPDLCSVRHVWSSHRMGVPLIGCGSHKFNLAVQKCLRDDDY